MPKTLIRATVSQISETGHDSEKRCVTVHFFNNCHKPIELLNAPHGELDTHLKMMINEDFVIWENKLCFVQPNGHPDEPLVFLDGIGAGTLCQGWGLKIARHFGTFR